MNVNNSLKLKVKGQTSGKIKGVKYSGKSSQKISNITAGKKTYKQNICTVIKNVVKYKMWRKFLTSLM